MREGGLAEGLGGPTGPGEVSHFRTSVVALVTSAPVALVPDTLLRLILTWTPMLKPSLLPETVGIQEAGILQEGLGHREGHLRPFAGQGW